jgi:hypothetical protein
VDARKKKEKIMRKPSLLISLVMLTLLSISGSMAAQHDDHSGHALSGSLTGSAEVPGPGDTDGAGTAKIMLKPAENQVFFELTVSNIGEATAAHIHEAPAGKAGPPVVTLTPAPAKGSSKNCVAAEAAVIKRIEQNPANFYVNVHNAEFPNGAVRAQLSK